MPLTLPHASIYFFDMAQYELFVLGELTSLPMHGYLLQKILSTKLGPFPTISNFGYIERRLQLDVLWQYRGYVAGDESLKA